MEISKIICLILVITFISISACVEVERPYRDPNCATLDNVSENRSVEHHGTRMVGKIMQPYTYHVTEYHAYTICLNGSQYDAGWR